MTRYSFVPRIPSQSSRALSLASFTSMSVKSSEWETKIFASILSKEQSEFK